MTQYRQYSSISQDTTLASGGVSATATSMTVATGTGAALMGGITLTTNYTFTVALDPDTVNEEIIFITAQSVDTFTIVRGRAGTAGVVHGAGATVRHVLTSDDLNWFNTTSPGTISTAKGDIVVATGSQAIDKLALGTNGYVLTADSTQTTGIKWATSTTGSVTSITAGTGLSGGTITTTGTIAIDTATTVDKTTAQTLTNKTLTAPQITQAINAQTGTSYTLVIADDTSLVTLANAAAIALTIPLNSSVAFPIGACVDIVQFGAGQVTVSGASGVTLVSTGGTSATPKTRVQNSAITLRKLGTDSWIAIGDCA